MSRQEPRGPRAAGLLLLIAATCAPPPAANPPRLTDWSGRDGGALPLDQPLRLEFDAPLAAPVRASAVTLVDEAGRPAPGVRVEAAGRFLTLIPRLPTHADLADGSLRPAETYRLVLHGAPRLDALQAFSGGVLVGDLEVAVRTLPADDGGALLGFGEGFPALRVAGLRPGEVWQLPASGAAPATLQWSGGVDPRTLEPALLLGPGGAEQRRCALKLVENRLDGATLEVDFGDWTGWGMLVLPEGLEGLGGTPLSESHRAIRVRRSR